MSDFIKGVAGLITAIVALGTLLLTLGVLRTPSNPSSSAPPSVLALPGSTFTERMDAGVDLTPGDVLVALNGESELTLQPSGDLVLYLTADNKQIWDANTAGRGGERLQMQGDGNLVLVTASGRPVWTPGYAPLVAGAWLVLQDDHNLVLVPPNGGDALWATHTDK